MHFLVTIEEWLLTKQGHALLFHQKDELLLLALFLDMLEKIYTLQTSFSTYNKILPIKLKIL